MSDETLDEDQTQRRTTHGENRWPPVIATLVAIAVYALLPEELLLTPRIAIPLVETALLVALMISQPRRMARRTHWSRVVSVLLAGLVIFTNLTALGVLVASLLNPSTAGPSLLLGAMEVWVTNVIGFALLYWELDRGGPVARRLLNRKDLPPADWRFSQDETADNVTEVAATSSIKTGWIPVFVDYLYLSTTNSSAFSPTDTMPLSTRAKLLMALQATAALLITLLVIARRRFPRRRRRMTQTRTR